MSAFVLIVGSIGIIGAYILGLYMHGHHVRQKQLEELAMLFAEDKERFGLYFYKIAVEVMKKKVAQQEADLKNNSNDKAN
jgi:hypothetical protein